MGLLALMLLQHARSAARFDAAGEIVLLDDQDRSLWNGAMIAEGLALIDKAMRHRRPGPYQVQAAIAALHDRAARPEDTDWAEIDQLYATLERLPPSPVVTLNRAVAVNKVAGAEAALAMHRAARRAAGRLLLLPRRARAVPAAARPRRREAREAFDRAIALANTPAEAAHIRLQLDRLEAAGAPKPLPKGEGGARRPKPCGRVRGYGRLGLARRAGGNLSLASGLCLQRRNPSPSRSLRSGPHPLPLGEVCYSAALSAPTSAMTSSVWRPMGGGSRRMLTGDLEKRRPGFIAR